MSYLVRPLGLGFCALMIIMAFQIATKKGLCMDSSIVYKIDNISSEKTESMYACRLHRPVAFSNFLSEQSDQLSSRIAKAELVLAEIGAQEPLEIEVSPELLETNAIEKSIYRQALAKHLKTSDSGLILLLTDFLTLGGSSSEDELASAWWPTYQELSPSEKIKFYRFVLQALKSKDADIKSLTDMSPFSENFQARLKRFDSQSEFDFIVESDDEKFPIEQLVELSRQHASVKIAFANRGGVYILPFFNKVKTAVHSEYRILAGAKNPALSLYTKNTEHLLILPKSTGLNFSPLFTGGIESFVFVNKSTDFIQFHMPSYLLKAKELSRVNDYFAFVKNQQVRAEKKALGWLNSEWQQDRQAFKPVAAYDVIQYYRARQ